MGNVEKQTIVIIKESKNNEIQVRTFEDCTVHSTSDVKGTLDKLIKSTGIKH